MFRLVAVILTLTIVSLTLAVPSARAQGTKSEHDACRPDVARLCRGVRPPDQGPILDCLKSNRQRLSSACRKVLEEHNQ